MTTQLVAPPSLQMHIQLFIFPSCSQWFIIKSYFDARMNYTTMNKYSHKVSIHTHLYTPMCTCNQQTDRHTVAHYQDKQWV